MGLSAVDFAARKIPGKAIKVAGHSAVLCYVSPSRPGSNFGAKPVDKAYTDDLIANGLQIVSIYQYGKPGGTAPSDYTTGFEGGKRMAREALLNHFAAGGSGWCPIFFAVDDDINVDTWNDEASDFFRGVNEVLGLEWTGIYGSSKVCAWAIEDGVVGRTSEGNYWTWQTQTWSGGVLHPDSQAVLFQRIVDTPSNPGPLIDGSRVDVNDILANDYGQWSINRDPNQVTQPTGGAVTAPLYTELDRMGDSRSNRNGAKIRYFLLHTEEGNQSAEGLAGYLNDQSHDASYHYTLKDGILCDVVDTDYASWSVLDANSYAINLCFAGSRAAWSRDQWLEIEDDIRIAAWVAVQDCKRYGIPTDVIIPPYAVRDGVSDHKFVTQALGIGTHTDVGYNFPWDVFERFVKEFVNPVPTVNLINEKEKVSPWLGNRIHKDEQVTPDGRGRYVKYDNGYIYWTPETGAHPIPTHVFETYETLGWETGPLGYPIGDHSALPISSDPKVGDVQAFERGTIYRKFDKPGYWVHGEIGNRWMRSGYEKGDFGWPISNEIAFDAGSYQDFENGRIYWPGTRSTIALLNKAGADSPVADTQ